jgi:NitT/TauT family transport system substrate-binding protein
MMSSAGSAVCNTGRRAAPAGLYLLLVIALTVVLPACRASPPPGQPPEVVTLQLKWIHQAQFAGYYMALERGYYRDENLDVKLLEGGWAVDIADRLEAGLADFAVMSPETALLARGSGAKPTAIASIYSYSPVVYVAAADSGIVRPRDFAGRTVAALDLSRAQKDLEVPLYAMLKKVGMDISAVKLVPWEPDYASFYAGRVDITPCYCTVALIAMKQKGLKLNLIWPSDYDINFYSDTVFAHEDTVVNRPELVLRFLRASLKGWRDVIQDIDSAVDVTLKYARIRDRAWQKNLMEAQLPLVYTGEDHIGWMKQSVWHNMHAVMRESGSLAADIDIDRIYTLRFLNEIYGSDGR